MLLTRVCRMLTCCGVGRHMRFAPLQVLYTTSRSVRTRNRPCITLCAVHVELCDTHVATAASSGPDTCSGALLLLVLWLCSSLASTPAVARRSAPLAAMLASLAHTCEAALRVPWPPPDGGTSYRMILYAEQPFNRLWAAEVNLFMRPVFPPHQGAPRLAQAPRRHALTTLNAWCSNSRSECCGDQVAALIHTARKTRWAREVLAWGCCAHSGAMARYRRHLLNPSRPWRLCSATVAASFW